MISYLLLTPIQLILNYKNIMSTEKEVKIINNTYSKIIDLEYLLFNTTGQTTKEKYLNILKKINKGVYLYAISGIPIKKNDYYYCLLNTILDSDKLIKKIIKDILGCSGLMTYLNQSNLSTTELGNLCEIKNHVWAYNWTYLTFLNVNQTENVHLSLLRDKSIYEHWFVNGDSKLYGFTISLKDLKKFCSHFEDKSFDKETRDYMNLISQNFSFLWT